MSAGAVAPALQRRAGRGLAGLSRDVAVDTLCLIMHLIEPRTQAAHPDEVSGVITDLRHQVMVANRGDTVCSLLNISVCTASTVVRGLHDSYWNRLRRACAKRHSRMSPSLLLWWSCQNGMAIALDSTRIEDANCATASEFEH
jgi:hypothetical protein